jgi:hypothetical protein
VILGVSGTENPDTLARHQPRHQQRVTRRERIPARLANVGPMGSLGRLGEHHQRAVAADEDEMAARVEENPPAEEEGQEQPGLAGPLESAKLV